MAGSPSSSKRFALIGAAGYVAPRHMRAIREVGGDLVVAFDPNDSVGVIDGYFPDARFFVEFERFDRHVDKLRRSGEAVDHVSICSPNYLHDAHVRFALRSDADAICEKPLVLNPWNLDGLADIAARTNRKIHTILQLRLHPTIRALRERVQANKNRVHDVVLTYITSRGRWYDVSWKGDDNKSGGIATNIGVHFFDVLTYIFGAVRTNVVQMRSAHRAAGYLELERARVIWFLSIAREDLPESARGRQTTWRSMSVDGAEMEFSEGFTDLHTESYRKILAGRGFGLEEVRPSIEIVSALRSKPLEWSKGERHPMARADAT
ncbi:MAG: Gfo/Idh/MocA family oxidoreductase [Pseudorhodoplanes sp.]|nr:Gfo/Idh/MocA family oxidoreductase [Pseudorhodoplanes sp.]MCQ3943852.1 oxidoreductase [Alphaproteobacteria bacterium]GIK79333.1 MAG: oxidoreductase [Alphaproteobacteria bacterium]